MGKKRASGEGTYYHDLKRGNWQYKLTIGFNEDGFPVRKTFYGKTQAEARQKGQDYLKELDGKRINVSPSMKLGDWMDKWLICYKKGAIKQTSYHQLELLVKKIPHKLQSRKVSDITPVELQSFINEFSVGASKSYMDKMRVIIRSVFEEAQENGLCATNPARRLKVPRITENPRETYTKSELGKIVSFASGYHNHLIAVAVVALLFTGLRRGELLGLAWDDVGDSHIAVNRAVYLEHNKPTVRDFQAKTAASIRKVPIVTELKQMIESLPHNGRYVFGTRNGTLMHPRNFNRDYTLFFEKLRELSPEVRLLSPHCCRHTYATLTLFGGADVRVVQALLGHSNIQTTSRYTHPDQTVLYNAVQGMAAMLVQDKEQDN